MFTKLAQKLPCRKTKLALNLLSTPSQPWTYWAHQADLEQATPVDQASLELVTSLSPLYSEC